MTKKFLVLFISLCLMLAILPTVALAADDTLTSGTCGDGVVWKYEPDLQPNSGEEVEPGESDKEVDNESQISERISYYDAGGTLTISFTGTGTGKMEDYDSDLLYRRFLPGYSGKRAPFRTCKGRRRTVC